MQERSTDVSPEEERLFQEMEAELARYNEEFSRCQRRGLPEPPEPQFNPVLYREMRDWQGRRLDRIVDEEVVPLIKRRFQQWRQQETE